MTQESHVPLPISLGKAKQLLFNLVSLKRHDLRARMVDGTQDANWDEEIELASNSNSTVQAVAVGAGPIGEKFSELGDAMVGALVPNPCHDSSCNPSAGWIES
jgi:hypothetical protein